MKTVNVRQLKNNPTEALRMAREAPVVVLNRDQPEAVLFHLDEADLLAEPGVRLALASALYKDESVSLGRAAKIAGVSLAEFMMHVSAQGLPVIRASAKAVHEDVKKLEAWLKKRSKKGSSSATRAL
jgi:predicted HTH domain antitoxin